MLKVNELVFAEGVMQTAEHSNLLLRRSRDLFVIILGEKSLVDGDFRLGHDLKQRASRDLNEPRKVRPGRARASFRDVGRDRNGRSSHLVCKAEAFRVWKFACDFINCISELNRFLPDIEFFKVEGEHSPLLTPSTFNIQPSTLARCYREMSD